MNKGDTKDFAYTGSVQSWTVEASGIFKLEAWGGAGGSSWSNCYGGWESSAGSAYGAYTVSYVKLKKNQTLYIVVGGAGTTNGAGGYNGGAKGGLYRAYNRSGYQDVTYGHGGGGGATHFATANGLLSSLSSNTGSILCVAGGAGGSCSCSHNGGGNPSVQGQAGGSSVGGTFTGVGTEDCGGGGYQGGNNGYAYYNATQQAGGGSSYYLSVGDYNGSNTAGANNTNGKAKLTLVKKTSVKLGDSDTDSLFLGETGIDSIYEGDTEL